MITQEDNTKLNPENAEPYVLPNRFDVKQREAICLDKGYHLVLAPAGCGKTDILAERVHRAIHNGVGVKAKGLEFENVIVYGCVNDIYPYFSSIPGIYAYAEDTRKLYVAMSRAKKRLCLLTFKEQKGWHKEISPFLRAILSRHKFRNLEERDDSTPMMSGKRIYI